MPPVPSRRQPLAGLARAQRSNRMRSAGRGPWGEPCAGGGQGGGSLAPDAALPALCWAVAMQDRWRQLLRTLKGERPPPDMGLYVRPHRSSAAEICEDFAADPLANQNSCSWGPEPSPYG